MGKVNRDGGDQKDKSKTKFKVFGFIPCLPFIPVKNLLDLSGFHRG
jgi:hypothetical protein